MHRDEIVVAVVAAEVDGPLAIAIEGGVELAGAGETDDGKLGPALGAVIAHDLRQDDLSIHL